MFIFQPQQFLMLITYQSSADEYGKPAGRHAASAAAANNKLYPAFQLTSAWWKASRQFMWGPAGRRPQSHQAHVIARSWISIAGLSSFLAPRTLKDWMIDLACIRRSRPASHTLTPKRARDLSIHDTWIIWRLVFLPSLIYRCVIIRRSQRHRRHRSCITILRRARHPTSRTVHPAMPYQHRRPVTTKPDYGVRPIVRSRVGVWVKISFREDCGLMKKFGYRSDGGSLWLDENRRQRLIHL